MRGYWCDSTSIRYAARRLVTKSQERKNKEDKLKSQYQNYKRRFIREILGRLEKKYIKVHFFQYFS